ncbi:MAG: hypothetical protein ABIJ56_13270 [Pseudomonadota bacterium]
MYQKLDDFSCDPGRSPAPCTHTRNAGCRITEAAPIVCILLALALLTVTAPVEASENKAGTTWLPGAARDIPRTDSASRDAPVFEYAYGPAAYDTIGGEWGWLKVKGKHLTFRLAQYAMLPMENYDSKKIFPPGELWRGMTGGSISFSLDSVAKRLGEGGGLELSVVLSHESDHGELDIPEKPTDIPLGGGGQALTPDIAIRIPFNDKVTMIIRVQDRIFLNGALIHAPGADLILRYRLTKTCVPIIAVFAEGIFPGKKEANNGYFVRTLFGLTVPGRIGEATFFFSVDAGNGKGLLINTQGFHISGGVRYAPFAW